MAVENGWYSRFDPELHDIVSCEADHPDARVDIIRALERIRLRKDRGPITAETIAARSKVYWTGSVGFSGTEG